MKNKNIRALHNILLTRQTPIHQKELALNLNCSSKTIKRYVQYLKDDLNAPITEPARAMYQYDKALVKTFIFPEFFMTIEDVQSMALMLGVLREYTSSLMTKEFKKIEQSLEKILHRKGIAHSALEKIIKIVPINHPAQYQCLQAIADALMQQVCVRIKYSNYSGEITYRQISPQRIFYYRDQWYLDAYCHQKQSLRTFKLSRIQSTLALPSSDYVSISQAQIDSHVSTGYGVFAGQANQTAVLEFKQPVASDVAIQQWHPEQLGQWLGDVYQLSIPYSADDELIQDILRYVPYVCIKEPTSLKKKLISRLNDALAQHQ